ncbi:Ty3/Gypsy family RNase HI domain-containing protein [Xanthomonas sp. A2111]|uniref:Ty3/Gypsy family RNase HI domain-containing protein n=1 Tax=Xanthomonas hawaiiensis TaxID=3003247 RepID=A0ABU2IC14_9XANT|nr:ribonuclease H family protein [Xanthomonas sp. A2111]MDS9995183.1 Ty3/Gypsy family RNase HI domain-containing protein [Xanthomonas sp. A2111]
MAAPLRRLTRKDADWEWDEECEKAFVKLKEVVGKDLVLHKLDYGKDAGRIYLAVDSSQVAAGAVLSQMDKAGYIRPVRYESVVFTEVESRYSQPKLELCGVAKILKKLQHILWGQHFELQVDAKSLIQMINSPSLPNAPMTRWVAFIQHFSFDLVHKPGKTFTMPDGLSRRPPTEEDSDSEEFDEDIPIIKASTKGAEDFPYLPHEVKLAGLLCLDYVMMTSTKRINWKIVFMLIKVLEKV